MGIGNQMIKDVWKWTEQERTDCEKIAKAVQKEMLARIPGETPVGRGKGGHMRDNWVKGDIKLKDGGGTLYGVRNKLKPSLVHLVNFPHRIVVMALSNNSTGTATFKHVYTDLYRVDTGKYTKGNPFVDRVQEWGINELNRRLSEYFNRQEG